MLPQLPLQRHNRLPELVVLSTLPAFAQESSNAPRVYVIPGYLSVSAS